MESEGGQGVPEGNDIRILVDRALDLAAGDREGLPGLVRLNAFRFPRLRFTGYQLLLLFAALHLEAFGGGFRWDHFLPLLVGVEVYALGAWFVLHYLYERSPRVDLGDLFVLLDLPAFAVVVWWTGGSASHLWPIFLLHTADQLWMGRRRTFQYAVACVIAYAAIPLAEHLFATPTAPLVEQLWKVGALAAIAFMIAAVAREPLEIQHRTLAARDWILKLDRQSRELAEARSRAEAASAAKTDFLARMSHELRTPMNSVIGFANLLLKRPQLRDGVEGEQYLQRIRGSAMHLLSMINDLLDVARIEEGQLQIQWEPVALGSVVHDAVDTFSLRAREQGVSLVAEVPDGLHRMNSDELRLRQVITNLVGNALKFTEEGEVRLRVKADSHGEPLALHVSDTGKGIRPEDRERIFLPFEQAEDGYTRTHQGSGLGLAISRAICAELGYTLSVESAVGEGSTFTVHFREDGSPGV